MLQQILAIKPSVRTICAFLVLASILVLFSFSSMGQDDQGPNEPARTPTHSMTAPNPDLGSGRVHCSRIPGTNASEIYTDENSATAVTVVVSTGAHCWAFFLKNAATDDSGVLQGEFVGDPTPPGRMNHTRTFRDVRNLTLICEGQTELPEYCSYRIVHIEP